MKTPVVSAALFVAGIAAAAPSFGASILTDADVFAMNTSDVTVETFDNRIVGPTVFDSNTTITFDGGITSTATTNQQFNEVRDGAFRGGTRRGRSAEFDQTLTFDFGREITAFGGDFTGAGGILVSGMFEGMTQTFAIGDSLMNGTGFFGLISDTAFSSVTFSTNQGGFLPFGNPTVSLQAINFRLDNLAAGSAAGNQVPPIPLPASALLLMAGLGGFGALRVRSRDA